MIEKVVIENFIQKISQIKNGTSSEYFSKHAMFLKHAYRRIFQKIKTGFLVQIKIKRLKMKVDMSSFGEMLMSRPAGREAFWEHLLIFFLTLNKAKQCNSILEK